MTSGDEPISTTAHLWALDPVVTEIQMCPAATAAQIEELMDVRKIDFLTSDTSTAARKFKKAYNSPITHLPVLPTLGQPEAAPYLHPYVLKILLRKDQESNNLRKFFSTLKGTSSAEQGAEELIEHLDDMHYTHHTSVLNIHSPAMDRYFKQSSTEGVQNTTSIMSCGAILPLEYSALANNTSTHLITGVRIYIFYPPTPHNMKILGAYLDGHGKEDSPNHIDVCKTLRGGITFIQRPGQVLCIPPYCLTVVFATKTSVSVSYRWRGVQGLPLRLKYVELLHRQFLAVEPTAQRHLEASMECLLTRLYVDISAVLYQGKATTMDQVSTITDLGANWKSTIKKKNPETRKVEVVEYGAATQFRDLVKDYTSGELKHEILMNISRLWNKAVQTHGLEECPVCQERIDKLGVTFIKHFWASHWGQFENVDAVEGEDAWVERLEHRATEDDAEKQEPPRKKARIDEEIAGTIQLEGPRVTERPKAPRRRPMTASKPPQK